MSILDELREETTWKQYRAIKAERNQLTKKELKQLDDFIMSKGYESVTDTFSFGYPVKKIISKMNSQKKRTVYSYSEVETWVLKVITYLLYRYDEKIPHSCYSFRRNVTAKRALDDIRKTENLDNRYALKLDIHDYFNSIDTALLSGCLREIITDDDKLLIFFENLLNQDKCIYEGEAVEEKRGAMAGVPLASFFANVYLMDLDRSFEKKGIPYFRYSDDMILFTNTAEEINECYEMIVRTLEEKKLILNESKTKLSYPGEQWEFLGFRYENGKTDLSASTVEKMNGRIRRKAHRLYRWRKQNDASYERVARALIRSLDNKFYDLSGNKEFTWSRFYFPVITVSDGLHEIDEYMVMSLRYLYSGKYGKSNYKVSYESLKKLGYTPLVAEYYNWKRENEKLSE